MSKRQYFTLPHVVRADSEDSPSCPRTVRRVRGQSEQSKDSPRTVRGQSEDSPSSPSQTLFYILLGLCSDSARTLLGLCSDSAWTLLGFAQSDMSILTLLLFWGLYS